MKNPSPLGFVYSNPRAQAGFESKDYGECVVTSLSILTGFRYKDIRRDLAYINSIISKAYGLRIDPKGNRVSKYWIGKKTFKFGTCVDNLLFKDYLNYIGLKHINLSRLPVLSPSECYKRFGDCVVTVRTPDSSLHSCVVKGGKLYDYYDYRTVLWEGEIFESKSMLNYFKKQKAHIIKDDGDYRVIGLTEPFVKHVIVEK